MTPQRALVRTATLNGYLGLAKSLDIDGTRLMRRAGLDPGDLDAPDKWVPAAAAARLLDASARACHCADFAVRLAELRRLSTIGPLSVVLREEPDLRSVLRLLLRYERSYNEALRMRLEESEEIATLRLWRTSWASVSIVVKVHASRDCSRRRSGLPIRRRAAARASSRLIPSASASACAFISS